MIKRIVKLTLREDAAADFVALFEDSKPTILGFEGCSHLELWRQRDPEAGAVFFTYSVWESPECLEAYRQSDFFRLTWSKTKALFAGKAEAWSVEVV